MASATDSAARITPGVPPPPPSPFNPPPLARRASPDHHAAPDAGGGLAHPEHGVQPGHVRGHQVERAALAGELVVHAHAVAEGLPAAVDRLVAEDPQVPLDLDEQVGVTQADLVADGRPEQSGVFLPRNLGHRLCASFDSEPCSMAVPDLKPYSSARRIALEACGR